MKQNRVLSILPIQMLIKSILTPFFLKFAKFCKLNQFLEILCEGKGYIYVYFNIYFIL